MESWVTKFPPNSEESEFVVTQWALITWANRGNGRSGHFSGNPACLGTTFSPTREISVLRGQLHRQPFLKDITHSLSALPMAQVMLNWRYQLLDRHHSVQMFSSNSVKDGAFSQGRKKSASRRDIWLRTKVIRRCNNRERILKSKAAQGIVNSNDLS